MSEEPESAHRSSCPVSDVDESAHRSGRHELIGDTQIIQAIPAFGPVLFAANTYFRTYRVVHATHARTGVEQDSHVGSVRIRIRKFWRRSAAERYLERLNSARRRVYSAVRP